MNMNFYVLSKLLNATTGLLISGYIAFSLSFLDLIIQSKSTIHSFMCLVIAILLVAIHHYISIRVKFDADLLLMLGQESKHKKIIDLTKSFDQSLMYFKLMPKDKAGRSWKVRFNGCLQLFKLQIALLTLQFIVLIVIAMT